jgi:Zn-dependent protease
MDVSFAERLQMATIQFGPFLLAVVFHEFAHGLVARFWGDKTAQEQGRLTLNPGAHVDPIGTIAFPLMNMILGINLLIGWARPVPIDPRRFRKFRPGLFFVAFAGPAMNFLLAIVSALIFAAITTFVPDTFYLKEPFELMAQTSVFLNYALGLFNMLPLPPLDGGKIVESLLPVRAAIRFEQIARYSFFIILALLLLGAFQFLSAPIMYLGRATLVGALMLIGQTDGSAL